MRWIFFFGGWGREGGKGDFNRGFCDGILE